jgi:hypothetical protein
VFASALPPLLGTVYGLRLLPVAAEQAPRQ